MTDGNQLICLQMHCVKKYSDKMASTECAVYVITSVSRELNIYFALMWITILLLAETFWEHWPFFCLIWEKI